MLVFLIQLLGYLIHFKNPIKNPLYNQFESRGEVYGDKNAEIMILVF